LAASTVLAGPEDYVFMPTAEYGEREIDFNPSLTNISRSVDGNGTYLGYQWQVKHRWQ
jgi:hypothetical protein